jgi:hypothetical protein
MRTTSGRGGAVAVLTLAAALVVASPIAARQAGDALKDAQERLKVEAQRLEKEVRDAEREATQLGKNRPGEAVDVLKAVLAKLEEDTALPKDKRDALKRRLTISIRAYEGRAADRVGGRPIDPSPRYVPPADKRAQETRDRFDQTKAAFDRMKNNVVTNKDTRDRFGPAYNKVGMEIEKSARPVSMDVEFPADWVKKSQLREKLSNRLTAKERAIMKALGTVLDVEFPEGTTFQQAIDYLEKRTNLTIILDKQALKEAGVDYSSPVKTKLKATTRTVLKKLLGEVGLTYVVKNETIFVTTPERAKEMVTTRAYYIGDLAGVVDIRYGPVLGRIQMIQNINQIIVLMYQTIDPQSWKVNNPSAQGTIVFDPVSMRIIVTNNAEVHLMMGGAFR